jgi:hypothetical protein
MRGIVAEILITPQINADSRGTKPSKRKLTTGGTESTDQGVEFGGTGGARLHGGIGSLVTTDVAHEPQGVLHTRDA